MTQMRLPRPAWEPARGNAVALMLVLVKSRIALDVSVAPCIEAIVSDAPCPRSSAVRRMVTSAFSVAAVLSVALTVTVTRYSACE